MIRIMSRVCLMAGCLATSGFGADRTADEIVGQIDALQDPRSPAGPRKDDAAKKVALIGELLERYPADPRLAELLPQRWELLEVSGAIDRVTAEVDAVLAATSNPAVRVEAAYYKAELIVEKLDGDPAKCLPTVEAFIKLAPKDKRAGMLLYLIAYNEPDVAKRAAIEDRILKDHSDPQVVEIIEADRRQRGKVGQPFEVNFIDAIGGKDVSMEQLRGKVVVIDFWATWCGPCVDEMPRMKKIYAKYKSKGVEFIGISLDRQGDLPKLKRFVAENEITWPQNFEGKRFEGELAIRWDITSIPTVFVVDREGKLASVKGVLRLEAILDGLLKEQPKKPSADR